MAWPRLEAWLREKELSDALHKAARASWREDRTALESQVAALRKEVWDLEGGHMAWGQILTDVSTTSSSSSSGAARRRRRRDEDPEL